MKSSQEILRIKFKGRFLGEAEDQLTAQHTRVTASKAIHRIVTAIQEQRAVTLHTTTKRLSVAWCVYKVKGEAVYPH